MDHQESNLSMGKALAKILSATLMLLCLIGIAGFGYQFFGWLKTGQLTEMPLLKILEALTPIENTRFHEWVISPHGWHGLHQMTVFIFRYPLSLVIVCGLILWASMAFED
jgi:hypothetical protein